MHYSEFLLQATREAQTCLELDKRGLVAGIVPDDGDCCFGSTARQTLMLNFPTPVSGTADGIRAAAVREFLSRPHSYLDLVRADSSDDITLDNLSDEEFIAYYANFLATRGSWGGVGDLAIIMGSTGAGCTEVYTIDSAGVIKSVDSYFPGFSVGVEGRRGPGPTLRHVFGPRHYNPLFIAGVEEDMTHGTISCALNRSLSR